MEKTTEPVGAPARLASVPRRSRDPLPSLVDRPDLLELRLEPEWLRLSLVYATLSYRLRVANRGQEPVGPLRIGADMIAAHASRSNSEQLSFDRDRADNIHEVGMLAGGEVASLEGQLRLPLSEVRPVKRGSLVLLLPLVRFLVEHEGGNAPSTRAFTLGEPPDRAGAAMTPLRFDLGPRLISRLDSREVDVRRWLHQGGLRKAG